MDQVIPDSTEPQPMATPVVVQPISIEQAQTTARRQKARNRRNVWKDQTGSSLFEIDGADHVKLVCGEASTLPSLPFAHSQTSPLMPFLARPSLWLDSTNTRNETGREGNRLMYFLISSLTDSFQSDEEDDEYFSEEEEAYVRRDSSSQASLAEYLGNEAPTAATWIRLAKDGLAYLRTSPQDAISALQNCHNIRENVMKLIETDPTLSDESMAELLVLLEELNSVL